MPTRYAELSAGTDAEFFYSLDATFCPQCERQLPIQDEMPTHQRESAFHFCPHCRYPNPSDGSKNLDSDFKTPRLYTPATRPSSAHSSSSIKSFHFEESALFCQHCEHMLAIEANIPPDDRASAFDGPVRRPVGHGAQRDGGPRH